MSCTGARTRRLRRVGTVTSSQLRRPPNQTRVLRVQRLEFMDVTQLSTALETGIMVVCGVEVAHQHSVERLTQHLIDEPNNGSPSPCARRVQPRSRRLSSRRLRPGHDQGERRRPGAGAGLRGRRPSQAGPRAGRELHRPPRNAGSGRRANLPRPLACRPEREDRAARQGAPSAPLLPPRTLRPQRSDQGRPQAQRTVASQKEL